MSEEASRTGLKFALLSLIEQTDSFVRYTALLQGWYGPEFAQASGHAALYAASSESINNSLRQLGGISATIDATDTDPEQQVTLIEWRGPIEADKHRWLGMNAAKITGDVYLNVNAIQEFRQKLLAEMMTDV